MEEHKQTVDFWAIVELMGHQRIAGHVTEQQIGGTNMIRVDVPAVGKLSAFTKFFGAAAIYAITPCDQATATAAAGHFIARSISEFVFPSRPQLPGPTRIEDDYGNPADEEEED
jgi:hypothetical protein